MFTLLNRNHDGYLDATEVQKFVKAIAESSRLW